jgi:uncharacterized OB-fold protein
MWSDTDPIYRTTTASPARAWRQRGGRYRLAGTRCDPCELDFFPRRRVCPQCHSRELAHVAMPTNGTIVAAAEDHSPLIGHAGRAHRPFAIVRLDGGPAILTELVDIAPDQLAPGTAVELVVRKWRREANGLYQYGYKFRPRRDA